MTTLNDFKAYLGMAQNTSKDDVLMQMSLDSAIDAVKDYTGRTFATLPDPEDEDYPAEETRTYRGCTYQLYIDDAVSVSEVEVSGDNVTWTTATGWWLEPFNTTPKTQIVSHSAFGVYVRVTGVFAYGSEPTKAKQATLMVAARLFKRKDSVDGIAYGGDYGVVRISRFEDPDVVRLLDPLRRMDKVSGVA